MAPSNRKRPQSAPADRRKTAQLPFDEEFEPLFDSDPRFQHVPQFPSSRKASREEAIPTSVFDSELHQEELAGLEEGDHKPAYLFVDRGPGAGQLVPVRQGTLVIGRASVSDLRLQHGSISRRHTQITRKGERFYIRDLGSQNGTYVNRMRIATELEIFPGDQIALGNALLKLRGPKEQEAAIARGEAEPLSSPAFTQETTRGGRTSRGLVRIALFGGALGFGLAAVVMFALFKLPSDPSYQDAVGTQKTSKSEEGSRSAKGSADPVSEKINKVMAEKAKQEASEQERTAKRSADRWDQAFEGKKGKKLAARGRSLDDDDAPAPLSAKRSGALSKYEAGDVAGALAAAKENGDKDLAMKLSSFQARYDRAQDALSQQDGSAALTHFKSALDMDKKISAGGSAKYGAEIRRELSSLSVLAAQQFQKNGDDENAIRWYRSALAYNPENAKAKSGLAKAKRGEGGEEAPAGKKNLDDAFNDAPAPAPKKAKAKPSRSALDDAFND